MNRYGIFAGGLFLLTAAPLLSSLAGEGKAAEKIKLKIEALKEAREQDRQDALQRKLLAEDRYDDRMRELQWQLDEIEQRQDLERHKTVDERSRADLRTLQAKHRDALAALRAGLVQAGEALRADLETLTGRLRQAGDEASSELLRQTREDMRSAKRRYDADLKKARAEIAKEDAAFRKEVKALVDKAHQ